MANLDLSALDSLFSKGKDFELTGDQYEKLIKKPMPKSVPGIRGRNAPLARKAKEKGFIIASIVDKPVITRTVIFKKQRGI